MWPGVQAAHRCKISLLPVLRFFVGQKQPLLCHAQPPRPPQRSSSSTRNISPSPDALAKQLTRTINQAPSAAHVLQLVYMDHPTFNAIHTSTALRKLGQHVQDHPEDRQLVLRHPDFAVLLKLAEEKACTFGEQATGNVLSAVAKLGCYPCPQLISQLEAAVQRNLKDFSSQGLVKSVWSLAKMGHNPGQDLLTAIAEQAATNFDHAHGKVCCLTRHSGAC